MTGSEEPIIRRRTVPGPLRYVAQKLTSGEPLSDADRAGLALTLNMLADEIETEEPTS
jgi:hypothetical protein